MEFLTAEDVARIFKVSKFYVYKNYQIFGGIKLGRILRFEKKLLEVILNDRFEASRQLALGLLEKRAEVQEGRIRHQTGGKNGGVRLSKNPKTDKYGLYQTLRESLGRAGTEEDEAAFQGEPDAHAYSDEVGHAL
jgi:hypothetical protein